MLNRESIWLNVPNVGKFTTLLVGLRIKAVPLQTVTGHLPNNLKEIQILILIGSPPSIPQQQVITLRDFPLKNVPFAKNVNKRHSFI